MIPFLFKIGHLIAGKPGELKLENRIFNLVCFVAFLVGIISTIMNSILGLPEFLIIITSAGGFAELYFYITARFRKKYYIWPFIITTLIFLAVSWILNGGSHGSLNFVFILTLIILLSFTKQKWHISITIIILVLLLILHLAEYYYPEIIISYPDEISKFLDTSITILYVLLISAVVFSIIKGNYEIERQKALLQKQELEEKNYDITESIKYASVIQSAILNQERVLKKIFYNYFILWKPRDIVSGDFYWIRQIEHKIYFAVADCTGHGIPAAFLSIMSFSFLNEVIITANITPGEILNRLRRKMKKTLSHPRGSSETTDGMDISLTIVDLNDMVIEYSGAFSPAYILRKNKEVYDLIELKPDKQPIGMFPVEREFSSFKTELRVNDRLYLFTDGYYSQFSEFGNKKFLTRNFKNLIQKIQKYDIKMHGKVLDEYFEKWRGNYEQLDDVLVVGVQISR